MKKIGEIWLDLSSVSLLIPEYKGVKEPKLVAIGMMLDGFPTRFDETTPIVDLDAVMAAWEEYNSE